jgi:hypothetical protein
MAKASTHRAVVINLNEIRAQVRLGAYQSKISRALDSNRRSIGRLHTTGLMFSHEGARAGRDLLLAHQHLLKVAALLNRLRESPRALLPRNLHAAYQRLDQLLERTGELTSRTGHYLSRLRGE